MKRRDFLERAGLAGAGLLVAGCGARTKPSLSSNQRNVLLIISDALRADHLGCYGSSWAVTPNMDALAESGVAFMNAMSCSPATGPAHASLMTGAYQARHDVMLNEGRMREDLVTLAEVLDRAGYDTAAFISNPVLSRRTGLGLERGFRVFDDEMPSLDGTRGKPFRAAPETASAAATWLSRDRSRPFFLWVHLMEPHGPYEVPDPTLLRRVGSFAPLPGDPERLAVLESNRGQGGIPKYQAIGDERAPAQYRARYAARAGYVDQYVGQIVDAVHRHGLDGRTIVVFMSDHGELLGEGGYYFQHSISLLRPVLRIPLVIGGPGVGRAVRATSLAGTTDVLPTLLDLLELTPDVLEAQLEGFSLAPVLRGMTADSRDVRYAFCQYGHECAAMLGRYKYTIGGEVRQAPRLTDLETDPADAHDLSAGRPEVAADLEAKLRRALAGAPDLFVRGKGKTRAMSEEDRQRLRSLGYLQ